MLVSQWCSICDRGNSKSHFALHSNQYVSSLKIQIQNNALNETDLVISYLTHLNIPWLRVGQSMMFHLWLEALHDHTLHLHWNQYVSSLKIQIQNNALNETDLVISYLTNLNIPWLRVGQSMMFHLWLEALHDHLCVGCDSQQLQPTARPQLTEHTASQGSQPQYIHISTQSDSSLLSFAHLAQ